jgi:hypothetical protein
MNYKRKDLDDIHRGDTFNGLAYEVLVNGVAKDLTSTVIICEFRRGGRTGNVAKTLKVGSGFTKTLPLSGHFTMDAFIVDWEPDTYYYDVKFVDGGVVKTYTGGSIKVMPVATQRTS